VPIGTRKEFTGAASATKLASPITDTATSFTVAAGTGVGFPTGATGQFVIILDRGAVAEEKVLCDSRSGDVFTVNVSGRGHDGTTAASHQIVEDGVEHVIDAESMTDLMDHVYDTGRDDHTQYAQTSDLAAEVWLGGADLVAVGGSPSAASRVNWPAWTLDAAAVEAVAGSTALPTTWATFDVEAWWVVPSAGTGNVVFRATVDTAESGTVLSLSSYSDVTDAAAGVADEVVVTTLASGLAAPGAAASPVRATVSRRGTDAADTLAVDAWLIGIRLVKAS
jgi:hypothetical protein